jgi:S1-C subfamily serine protease
LTSSYPGGTMAVMLRAVICATLLSVVLQAAAVQAPTVLHIKVVLVDAERKATPVPRHALLISDNPASAAPRRVVTGPDGTADVRLPPANYTVESDEPVAFQGKAYQWTQTIDIVAGRDTVLELTVDNAEVEAINATTTTAARPLEADPGLLLMPWQNSVVALWTPTTRASGFVIDANGLIATNQRLIGTATSIEVQLTPTVKVAGSVIVADSMRDVAVIRIDPAAAATIPPVPLGCTQAAPPPVVDGQQIFAIEASLREKKDATPGRVRRVEGRDIVSDLMLATGGAGGPVFTPTGTVVGITSVVDDGAGQRRGNSRIVGIGEVCNVVASAEQKMKDVPPPSGTHLPVEPVRPFPVDALKDAAQHRAGNLVPYQLSSSGFDLAFITPLLTYAAQNQSEQTGRRQRSGGAPSYSADQTLARPLMDFGNWSEYVWEFPPVLLVRVTPKLVEGFWTKVARGAAQTQGVAIPPIKRFKSGFLRMRAFCGDAEITPIHPFKLEYRVSESDTIYEGLYVFDAGALGPSCARVRLVMYSEKEPEKGDTLIVDAKVIQQIWQDFAPYRAS